jgi:DNA-binding MarR family transcriptional regulator
LINTKTRRIRNGDAVASGRALAARLPVDHEPPSIKVGPLANHLGYLLRRAQVAVFQDFFAAFETLDIRPIQYSILTVIEQNPGLSQSQVSETLGIKRTNFVALLDTLEARHLARRAPTARDRRSYALFLTADGEALMGKLRVLASEHEQRLIDRLGADTHRQLFQPLRRLAALSGASR